MIDNAVKQWHQCLRSRVAAKGGRYLFELVASSDSCIFVKYDIVVLFYKFELLTSARYCGNVLKVWWKMLKLKVEKLKQC